MIVRPISSDITAIRFPVVFPLKSNKGYNPWCVKCDCICNLPFIIQIDTANESITLYGVLQSVIQRLVLPPRDLLVELMSVAFAQLSTLSEFLIEIGVKITIIVTIIVQEFFLGCRLGAKNLKVSWIKRLPKICISDIFCIITIRNSTL